MDSTPLALVGLAGLGAFHGLNPGMGWLFAAALGLQEGRARAVFRALGPLALGHAAAIGAAVAAVGVSGVAVPQDQLRPALAAMLIALGGFRLVRHRHPRLSGMRVGAAGLTLWSFLMATAHGAGLMVLPLVMASSAGAAADTGAHPHHVHTAHATHMTTLMVDPLTATLVHGVGYLVATALIAWLVYAKLGVALLRTAWVNLDLIWAGALILTGALTLVA